LVTSAIQPYRNSITGAAWGDQEDGEYASLFGSSKYSPAEFKLRLEGVKKIMTDKTASALNMYVNPVNAYDNVFEAGVNNTRTDNIIVAPDGTQIEIID
jgi:predicted RNA-binding protein with PUA domain